MAIDASTVAVPAGTGAIRRSHARASREYSMNARMSRTSATTIKTDGGANQTTPMTMAIRTTPLTTRVTFSRGAPPHTPARSLAGGAASHDLPELVLRAAML